MENFCILQMIFEKMCRFFPFGLITALQNGAKAFLRLRRSICLRGVSWTDDVTLIRELFQFTTRLLDGCALLYPRITAMLVLYGSTKENFAVLGSTHPINILVF